MKFYKKDEYAVTVIEHDSSVDEVLTACRQSKKQRYLCYQQQRLLVNQQPIIQNCPLKPGDELAIRVFIDEAIDFLPDVLPLDIVYEDEVLLIVNKPPGLLVHPDQKDGRHTLANAVSAYYHASGQSHAIRPIHRLDFETSGLVLFSKCSFFQPLLDEMLANKQIARSYLAIVNGALNHHSTQTIDAPIGSDRHVNNKYRVSKTGKPAVTHITCLKENQRKKISLVECQLETGRTHQIRVHLASIQRPILADPIYGKPSPLIQRCALHAYKLRLIHPMSMKALLIETKMPEDMQLCLKK